MSRIPSGFHLPRSVMGRVHGHSQDGAGSLPEGEIIFRRLSFAFFLFFLDSNDLSQIFSNFNWNELVQAQKKPTSRQEPLTLKFISNQVTTNPQPNLINSWFISYYVQLVWLKK